MSHVEYVLYDLLDTAGVRLVETRKLPDHLNACFHAPSRTIYVSTVIDSAPRVSAIAHELGHAYFDHDCSTSRAEREADE